MPTVFILFCLLMAAGFYSIACDLFHVPTLAATKAALQITQHSKHNSHSFQTIVFNISSRLSKLIKLNDYKKSKMTATMLSAGIALTPETYIARAIVNSSIKLLLAIPVSFVLPILVPLILIWAVSSFFEALKEADKIVEKKRDEIEYELPRFVSTITQELNASRDVLLMLEGYQASAGKGFRSELEITIADMRSGSQEKALTRLETRIGSSMLSEVVRGLQAVMRGDNGVVHFTMLSHDFKQLELQRLKLIAMKRPDKVKVFSYLMLACFALTYFVVMGVQVYSSVHGMF